MAERGAVTSPRSGRLPRPGGIGNLAVVVMALAWSRRAGEEVKR